LDRPHDGRRGIKESRNRGTKGSPPEPWNLGTLEPFEETLEDCFPASDRTLINKASRYALFPGGKRIRPLLCVAAYRACGGRRDSEVMPFACAIELIHSFSLIQDDLPCMDNDRERRGKPTLHIVFGEALALLAADALFARAFELCTRSTAPATRIVAATRELARVAGKEGIVTGQVQDLGLGEKGTREPGNQGTRGSPLESLNPRPLEFSPRALSARFVSGTHRLKTASLIGASLKIGATIAGAKPRTVGAMYQAGIDLGMLFQLTDDLLDAKQETTGTSSVKVLGRRETTRDAGRYLKRFERAIAGCGRQLKPTCVAALLATGRRVFNRA